MLLWLLIRMFMWNSWMDWWWLLEVIVATIVRRRVGMFWNSWLKS